MFVEMCRHEEFSVTSGLFPLRKKDIQVQKLGCPFFMPSEGLRYDKAAAFSFRLRFQAVGLCLTPHFSAAASVGRWATSHRDVTAL